MHDDSTNQARMHEIRLPIDCTTHIWLYSHLTMHSMRSTHRKHYTSLPRSVLGLPKLHIQARTERAKPHILAHVVTTHEAAAILDCFPGEIERLVENHTLVGRNIKTARGKMWIVCAACVAELYGCSLEEQQAIIKQAVLELDEIETYLDEEDN